MMNKRDIFSKKKNNLFQSSDWGSFSIATGRETWVIKSENIEALVIKQPLVRDKFYLYSPRGPFFSSKTKPQDMRAFLRKMRQLGDSEGAVFYRVEPVNLGQSDLFKFGFRKVAGTTPLSRQYSPMDTLVLDLTKSEEKLPAEF